MTPSTIPLLLLKTKSRPQDPYEAYFTSNPFQPTRDEPAIPFTTHFVPVLQHRHTNTHTLESIIVSGKLAQPTDGLKRPGGSYGALVVTSQRAVEALGAVLEALRGSHAWKPHITALFAQAKVYVVGPATSQAMQHLGFNSANIHGASCGNGGALAEFIVTDYNTPRQPILFLLGETHRDVIPKTLAAADIAVEELVVYETAVAESFRGQFVKAVQETRGQNRWIAVFSPAGADVAVEVLKEHCDHRDGGDSYIAAIGPTTEQCLVDVLERQPEAVAERPSPEGLWQAVTAFIKSQQNT